MSQVQNTIISGVEKSEEPFMLSQGISESINGSVEQFSETSQPQQLQFNSEEINQNQLKPYNELSVEDSSPELIPLKDKNGIEDRYTYEEYAPDGGWGWVIVFASLMNNFVLDGVAFSYGVMTSEIKKASKGVVGDFEYHLCGSVFLAITLLLGPLVSVLIRPFGYRILSILGSILAGLGFIISWAASPQVPDFWSFFWGFGIISGIGYGLMFTTSVVIVTVYFDKNRPLATGIAVTGSAVGSIVMPFFIEMSLNLWGWQGAMITLGVISLLSAVFGAMYSPLPKRIKKIEATTGQDENLAPNKVSDLAQILVLLSSPTFWILAISGGIAVLCYYVPSSFLRDRSIEVPFYATEEQGTWLPATIGASNTVGRVFFGILANSERVKYAFLIINGAVTFGGLATMLSVYATEYYQLVLYAIAFGQIVAVYGTLRSIIIMDFLGEEKFNMGFGVSLFFMGISSIFGNSLAGKLVELTGNHDLSFIVAGGLFVLSAVMCYPLRYIHRQETKHEVKTVNSQLPL